MRSRGSFSHFPLLLLLLLLLLLSAVLLPLLLLFLGVAWRAWV